MMKKLLLALLLTGSALAQTGPPSYQWVGAAPTGSCVGYPPIQIVLVTYAQYGCSGGTWININGGSGGGGAILAYPGIAYATSPTSSTVASSPQLAAALNTTPSTTLVTALLPTALQNNSTVNTQTAGTSNTTVANTAFVANAVAGVALPSQASNTLLGNATGSAAQPTALSASAVQTLLGLGSAAYQATSAFDAAGAANTAQTNAQNYAANASNISSGTIASARLPGTIAANTTGNANTATSATTASTASALAATPTLCSSGNSPTGILANGNATGCQAVGGGGSGSSPIFTHALTGTGPTALCNSTSVAAFDTQYLPMSGNGTLITLPASGACADGETLNFTISQPTTGSTTYTLGAGTATTPFTAGSGTTVVNSIPGGCPAIPAIAGSSPGLFIATAIYKTSLAQWQVVGCQSAPAQTAVTEATLTVVAQQYGNYGAGSWLAGTKAVNAGHFANVQVVNTSSGTCTTSPSFTVIDVNQSTQGVNSTVATTGSPTGTIQDTAQTLSFNAGDDIGLIVSVQGSGCSNYFSINAEVVYP